MIFLGIRSLALKSSDGSRSRSRASKSSDESLSFSWPLKKRWNACACDYVMRGVLVTMKRELQLVEYKQVFLPDTIMTSMIATRM